MVLLCLYFSYSSILEFGRGICNSAANLAFFADLGLFLWISRFF